MTRVDVHEPGPQDDVREAPQHGLPRSVLPHLLPGAALTAFVLAAAPTEERLGMPALFAFFVGIGLVIVPLELGHLMVTARRTTGSSPSGGVTVEGRRNDEGARAHIGPGPLGLAVSSVAGGSILLDDLSLDASAKVDRDALAVGPCAHGRRVDPRVGRIASGSGTASAARHLSSSVDVAGKRLAQFGSVLFRQVHLVLSIVQSELHGRVGRVASQVIDQNNLSLGSHKAEGAEPQSDCQLRSNSERVR